MRTNLFTNDLYECCDDDEETASQLATAGLLTPRMLADFVSLHGLERASTQTGVPETTLNKILHRDHERRGGEALIQERGKLAAMFLGPQAENSDLLVSLITDVLSDHIYWRRNFHPEDPFVIREKHKRTEPFVNEVSNLYQQLHDLLRRLKRNNIPFSNPRYIGHMIGDQLLTGIVGYFAAMLYNPNNVTHEVSPETTKLELEFAKDLAALFGFKRYDTGQDPHALSQYDSERKEWVRYEKDRAWGHICSGGTIANLEALWVARNLKYLPLAIRKACTDHDLARSILARDGRALAESTNWELLNLSPSDVLDLRQRALEAAIQAGLQAEIEGGILLASLPGLGLHRFLTERAEDPTPGEDAPDSQVNSGVVLVPATRHYSLAKVAEILGIGRGDQSLVAIPVDGAFRINTSALEQALRHCSHQRIPVIAVVSVCGTTEEGAIDHIHEIEALRATFLSDHGLSFYHHCDAAYGGYVACLFRDHTGKECDADRLSGRFASHARPWPAREVKKHVKAISQADSVTVDPHKLGFIPYPAGAVVFRDGRVKWEVAFKPGYLALPFIGSYIAEGSKPGAAAAACWLSTKVAPLHAQGHGVVINRLLANTYSLRDVLQDVNQEFVDSLLTPGHHPGALGGLRLTILNGQPDLNILCFLLNCLPEAGDEAWRAPGSLVRMNCFARAVYRNLSFSEENALAEHDVIVSYTTFGCEEYGVAESTFFESVGEPAMTEHLISVGVDPTYFRRKRSDVQWEPSCYADEIFVLRCTVMNPFLAVEWESENRYHPYYYLDTFRSALTRAIQAVLAEPQELVGQIEDAIKSNSRTD